MPQGIIFWCLLDSSVMDLLHAQHQSVNQTWPVIVTFRPAPLSRYIRKVSRAWVNARRVSPPPCEPGHVSPPCCPPWQTKSLACEPDPSELGHVSPSGCTCTEHATRCCSLYRQLSFLGHHKLTIISKLIRPTSTRLKAFQFPRDM